MNDVFMDYTFQLVAQKSNAKTPYFSFSHSFFYTGNIVKKLPRKTTVPESDTAIFYVELDSGCKNIRWTKNGEVIKPNDRTTITVSGTRHSLSIRECKWEDAGKIALLADDSRTSTQFIITCEF